MRILYVSQYFPPEPGAPAARVSELSRAWVRLGHEVTVLTGMPNHPTGVVPPQYRNRLHVDEDYEGVQILRTWIYAAPNRGRVRRSLAYATFAASAAIAGEFRRQPYDVLVATSPQFLCAVAGHAIARTRGIPFVFEVRDLWPESIVAVGALPKEHIVIRALERAEAYLYRASDRIVVVTDSFRDNLVSRGVPRAKIDVIKNGADLSRFRPTSSATEMRQRLGYEGRFVVAYVGTHGMAHGLDSVLNVAKGLLREEGIRFLFVGDGAERTRLEARAHAEGLDNTRFLGALPRDAMNEVYATADVCLVPLRKTELFQTVIPSKMFEIMAMERPLILSVDGEARRILDAAGAGVFVPPEDEETLRATIINLAGRRERLWEMGRAGRAFVAREYDRDKLARTYLELLARVAMHRRPQAAGRQDPRDC